MRKGKCPVIKPQNKTNIKHSTHGSIRLSENGTENERIKATEWSDALRMESEINALIRVWQMVYNYNNK